MYALYTWTNLILTRRLWERERERQSRMAGDQSSGTESINDGRMKWTLKSIRPWHHGSTAIFLTLTYFLGPWDALGYPAITTPARSPPKKSSDPPCWPCRRSPPKRWRTTRWRAMRCGRPRAMRNFWDNGGGAALEYTRATTCRAPKVLWPPKKLKYATSTVGEWWFMLQEKYGCQPCLFLGQPGNLKPHE